MKIRPALPRDANAIAATHAESWRLAYRGALTAEYLEQHAHADREALWFERFRSPRDGQYVAVAEFEGQLVGFACVFSHEHREWGSLLDNIHVALEFQGRGIGTALLRNAARWCSMQSPETSLYLWVLQSNLSAQHFYCSLGAANVGADVWVPPGGGSVPRYRFAWPSAAAVGATSANSKFDTDAIRRRST